MKVTKSQLKQIIKEELNEMLPLAIRMGQRRQREADIEMGERAPDEDHPGEICDQAHPDETHEEWKEAPLKLPPYSPETRKRFHRQQSHARELARHKRARGLKPKVG